MHVQIITFGLNGISEEDYGKMAEAVAPTIAVMPGLVSKAWLADPETNTYGGAYIWQARGHESLRRDGHLQGDGNQPALRGSHREGLRRLGEPYAYHRRGAGQGRLNRRTEEVR